MKLCGDVQLAVPLIAFKLVTKKYIVTQCNDGLFSFTGHELLYMVSNTSVEQLYACNAPELVYMSHSHTVSSLTF